MKLFISSLTEFDNTPSSYGGIMLSFDDNLRNESWIKYHNDYGISKNWRASFAINMNDVGEANYHTLNDYGHEIFNHTTVHPCGIDEYMLTHTAEEYYYTYVKPNNDYWAAKGIDVSRSFGYPCGNENQDVTDYLIDNNLTKVVRGYNGDVPIIPPFTSTTQGIWQGDRDYCFAPGFDILHLSSYNRDYYMDLLEYCRDNNKIMVLTGHYIGAEYGGAYVETDLVNDMIDYVNNNGMKMYLLNELNDL